MNIMMDFLDPNKKRAHTIRLYIGYILMACALVLGSAILFFEARGFDLNRKTGEIIQNGLIFTGAHPEQASIYANGRFMGKTNNRLTIPAGEYEFKFTRDGYRTWKRKFMLGGGEIERLDYIFLFPNKLSSTEITSYSKAPIFASQSPDRKWLLIQQPDNFMSLDLYDLSDEKNPLVTTISLPPQLMKQPAGSDDNLKLVEWSTDNRHVLVEHTFKDGHEFVVIDREQPAKSLNLNKLFDVPIYKIALRDKKPDKFHILDKDGGTLFFADSKKQLLSRVADKVYSFKSYGDNVIFYVTGESTNPENVSVNIIKDDRSFKVREIKASTLYPIDITRYDDSWYMAVGSNSDGKVYIYGDVFKYLDNKPSKTPAVLSIFKIKDLSNISVSANARFISAQGGSQFAVYDAEHASRYQYDTKLNFTGSQKANWMDGHRLTAVTDGKLRVWDYDGINAQTLVNANPNFLPFFDRDYDYLFTLTPSTKTQGQTVFTKTPMRTPADL